MPVKIRLQRHGKKGKPFYWIVAADSRAKRDGKYLEKLGIYNPNTNPATIELNIDNSVSWLQNGAQPSDTARAILSYKGALMKHHLLGGVRKGALTEEQMEAKFQAWLEEKEKSIASKVGGLDKAKADARKKALAAEKETNEKRALAAVTVDEPVEAAAEQANETPAEVVKETESAATETAKSAEEVVAAPADAVEEAVAPPAEKAETAPTEKVEAAPAEAVEEAVATPAKETAKVAEPTKEKSAKTESAESKETPEEAASGEEE